MRTTRSSTATASISDLEQALRNGTLPVVMLSRIGEPKRSIFVGSMRVTGPRFFIRSSALRARSRLALLSARPALRTSFQIGDAIFDERVEAPQLFLRCGSVPRQLVYAVLDLTVSHRPSFSDVGKWR